MADFSGLGLKADVVASLAAAGFTESFEVQRKVIPEVVAGRDVVLTSMTGSGKTLAFLAGFLGKINRKLGLQLLIVVPTRELCVQVGKEAAKVCDTLGFSVGMLYGGRDISGDYKTLVRKNQVIVATPGRLIDHVNQKTLKVGDVRFLVFDESDQMFDDGFYDDCVYLVSRISKDAQTVLSSATISRKVQGFMDSYLHQYALLRIGYQLPEDIVQEYMNIPIAQKNAIVVRFVQTSDFSRMIIFCNTKSKVASVAHTLEHLGIRAKEMSSDLDQKDRLQRLNLFKEGKIKVLVATDVAARGLHIEGVDVVLNYDVPTRPEFFVHRIGRTGRKGAKGYSLTLVCPEDVERFDTIKRLFSMSPVMVDEDCKRIE